MERSFFTFSWSWIVSLMIIGFAWKMVLHTIFPCASIWLKWLDPSDTAGFVSMFKTRQTGAVRVLKGLGVIALGSSSMAHLALTAYGLSLCTVASVVMQNGSQDCAVDYNKAWLEAKNRHFYRAVFNLHHFPAPDHCLPPWPWPPELVWALRQPSGRQAGLPHAHTAAREKGSAARIWKHRH